LSQHIHRLPIRLIFSRSACFSSAVCPNIQQSKLPFQRSALRRALKRRVRQRIHRPTCPRRRASAETGPQRSFSRHARHFPGQFAEYPAANHPHDPAAITLPVSLLNASSPNSPLRSFRTGYNEPRHCPFPGPSSTTSNKALLTSHMTWAERLPRPDCLQPDDCCGQSTRQQADAARYSSRPSGSRSAELRSAPCRDAWWSMGFRVWHALARAQFVHGPGFSSVTS
jgi:hypothetical protein